MSETKSPAFFSFWLIPDNAYMSKLQPMVDTFAARFVVPTFIPHITLSACWSEQSVAVRTIKDLIGSGSLGDLRARLDEPFTGDGSALHLTFGYRVHMQNATQQALVKANTQLRSTMDISIPDHWHMSLLYRSGGIVRAEANALIHMMEDTDLVSREFSFSKLMIVKGDGPIACEQDVSAWSVVEAWDI